VVNGPAQVDVQRGVAAAAGKVKIKAQGPAAKRRKLQHAPAVPEASAMFQFSNCLNCKNRIVPLVLHLKPFQDPLREYSNKGQSEKKKKKLHHSSHIRLIRRTLPVSRLLNCQL